MANENAVVAQRSVFLSTESRTDAHIVDILIEERCPSFVEHFTWPMVRPVLHTMLGYDKAVAMADAVSQFNGSDSFDFLVERLAFQMTLNHLDRMPASGRCIVAANHPTGLADGVAAWQGITEARRDVLFFANADALRVNNAFEDTIIPVEWVLDKRSPAKTKETLRRAKEAFTDEKCVVIFPSGKLAKMVGGQLTEQAWFSTVVSLARKQNCPVIPLNLRARNSRLYYLLSDINGELRDITLFNELLNKRNSRFELTFGPTISPDDLDGDPQQVTDQLKHYVTYELGDSPDLTFGESRKKA